MNKVDNQKQSYFYQYVATFTGVLAIISVGMLFGWSSPSLPILLKNSSELTIDSSEGGWITVAPSISSPLGCVLGALVMDNIGRKPSSLIVAPFLFVGWLTVAYANSAFVIICGRLLGGIGTGLIFTVLPMYICEIADKSIRGLLGASITAAYNLGILSINVIGPHFSIRTTAILSSLVPVLYFVTFWQSPESPTFLIANNKRRKAEAALKKLTGTENVDGLLLPLSSTTTLQSNNFGKVLKLFTDQTNRRALIAVLGLLSLQHASGILSIIFYCNTIFKESNTTIDENTLTVIYFIVQLVASALSSIMLDRIGRRPLLITSILVSGFALATLGAFYYIKNRTSIDTTYVVNVPIAALLVCTVSYNIGLTPIPVLIMSELFPASVKGFAACISNITYGAVGALIGKLFQMIKDEFGLHVPFTLFSLFCFIGTIFVIRCVPETKGKTLEEIQMTLRNERAKFSHEQCPLNTNKE